MTEKCNVAAIKAQMAALTGFTEGPWRLETLSPSHGHYYDDHIVEDYGAGLSVAYSDRANARLIAAAPDMHATILALCDKVDRLNAAIVRQAGAAKTLREATLAEVQHLRDIDRSEYHATTSLDGERKANEILSDENERLQLGLKFAGAQELALRAENERLREVLDEKDIALARSFQREMAMRQMIGRLELLLDEGK